jgi:transcriptional regulator with XRE-family HTH domain
MNIKQRRGRKSIGHFEGMTDIDRNLLTERVDKKFLACKNNKENLHKFEIIIGNYLDRYRKYMGIPAEEIASKIGVNIAQLRKYETADTSISAAKFFVAACYLCNNDKSKEKNSFFNSLINELQKLFSETKIVSNEEIVDFKISTIQKVRKKLDEEIIKLDLGELRKVNQILSLINKNKPNIENKNKDNNEVENED